MEDDDVTFVAISVNDAHDGFRAAEDPLGLRPPFAPWAGIGSDRADDPSSGPDSQSGDSFAKSLAAMQLPPSSQGTDGRGTPSTSSRRAGAKSPEAKTIGGPRTSPRYWLGGFGRKLWVALVTASF